MCIRYIVCSFNVFNNNIDLKMATTRANLRNKCIQQALSNNCLYWALLQPRASAPALLWRKMASKEYFHLPEGSRAFSCATTQTYHRTPDNLPYTPHHTQMPCLVLPLPVTQLHLQPLLKESRSCWVEGSATWLASTWSFYRPKPPFAEMQFHLKQLWSAFR